MTETKQQALDKMLEEMNKPHDEVLDYIHNVLCESEDEELFKGILVEGKTITNAFKKMAELARKSTTSSSAFFSPQKGMEIVIDYFKGAETEVKPIIGVKAGVSKADDDNAPKTSEMSREEKTLLIWAKAEKERQENEKAEKLAKKAEQEAKKLKQDPDVLMDIFQFGVEPLPKTQSEIIAEIKAEAKANAWEDEVNDGDGEDEVMEDEADE